MTTGGYILTSAVGGLIAGAIGAAVAESSDSHPVLKGALVVGAIDAVLAAALTASSRPALSGGSLSSPRFP